MPKKKDHSYTNQHIVPKAYLNRFATKTQKGKYRIGVVSKNGQSFINSTDNVGYIKNYYDIPLELIEDKKAWEHFYSKAIEGPCKTVIDNLIVRINMSTPSLFHLTGYDKIYLSIFIISQITRVPAFIDYWQKTKSPELLSKIKSNIIKDNKSILNERMIDVINNVNFTEEEIKQMILFNVNNPDKIEKYVLILMNRIWCVCYNKNCSDVPFITSDNPVVLINFKDGIISNTQNGIGRNDTDIYFPLTPKISLVLFASGEKCLNDADLRMITLDNSMIKTIEFFNYLEMQNCTYQAFYPLNYFHSKYGVE